MRTYGERYVILAVRRCHKYLGWRSTRAGTQAFKVRALNDQDEGTLGAREAFQKEST